MNTNTKTLSPSSDLEQRLLQAIEDLNNARQREAQAEQRYARAGRRARLLGGLAFAVLIGTLALSTGKPVGAQGGYGPTLTSLQNQVNSLLSRVTTVEGKTQFQSADGVAKTTRFVGCNVLIQSGSGSTDDNVATGGSISGLGNLQIGYNRSQGVNFDIRSGSHNLILGDYNNYRSFGGIVAGLYNAISGPYASVSGGDSNSATGLLTSVSGGSFNTASGDYASVSGGTGNFATGREASVSGGYQNTASGSLASVCGGDANTASGSTSTVSGGDNNTASGTFSSVSGGNVNTASGSFASVSGGNLNKADGYAAAVLAGYFNDAYGTYSTVCGGSFCSAGGHNPNGDFNINLGGFATSVTAQYGHNP